MTEYTEVFVLETNNAPLKASFSQDRINGASCIPVADATSEQLVVAIADEFERKASKMFFGIEHLKCGKVVVYRPRNSHVLYVAEPVVNKQGELFVKVYRNPFEDESPQATLMTVGEMLDGKRDLY